MAVSFFHSRPFLTTLGILMMLNVLVWREYRLLPDGRTHLHVLDVGQGDGILLVSPTGKQIVIDGGPDLSIIRRLGEHMPFFDRTIELLVLTHPDADHITAFPELLRRYTVERILLTGIDQQSDKYHAFLHEVTQRKIPTIFADPAKDIDMGDGLILDVVWPDPSVFGTLPKHPNNMSVVIRALTGSSSVLLTGDIEEDAERAILQTGADLRSTILKVPHHGSKTSSSTGFLLAVDPDLVLISAGKDNRYGHPHQVVLDRYEMLDISYRITAFDGDLHFVLE